MQILPLLLIAVILLRKNGLDPDVFELDPVWVWFVTWLPIVVLLVVSLAVMRFIQSRIDRTGMARGIVVADRLLRVLRWLTVLHYCASVLLYGWFDEVRRLTTDLILIDELIIMTPALLSLIATWWLYYPIERRIRSALLLRTLDEGRPVYSMPSRGKYVLLQVRMHLLLLLVPILVIFGLSECIEMTFDVIGKDRWPLWVADAAALAAGATVFLLAPRLVCALLDVHPLPDGELRDQLTDICDRHKVKTRQLLIWNTNGMMINAAVMGLIGRIRYVLMTDALLQNLTRRQVQAVMAHEVGHVRQHHIPWLVVALLASLMLSMAIADVMIYALGRWATYPSASILTGLTGAALIGALILFGWISRRFERQADTFAVKHLSAEEFNEAAEANEQVVTYDAVAVMSDSLEAVARLNSVLPNRKSWRHGSIRWRQLYLQSILGRRIDALPIDVVVKRIKFASASVLAMSIAYATWAETRLAPEHSTTDIHESPFTVESPDQS